MTASFPSAVAVLATLALLSGVPPRWPLTIVAVTVAIAALARLLQSGSADPALLALLAVAIAKPVLLRQWPTPPRRSMNTPLVSIVSGAALIVPSLLAGSSVAAPIGTTLVGLALLGFGPDRRLGLLVMEAAVAAAAVGGGSASIWVASALGLCVLATRCRRWLPAMPLAGLLVAALGLALEPAHAGAALLLAGAWLAAGIWPLGRWTRAVAGWRFGGVALAATQAVALFAAMRGATEWHAGAAALMWAGALGVGVSGAAMLRAGTPVRRLAADAAVQAALVACAFAIGGAAVVHGLIHLMIRAPLLALGTRAPPGSTDSVLRWARAGLPLIGTFWTTFAIASDAGTVEPWLLALLIPGLLAHVAATWRAPDAARATPAWVAWLAMAPSAVVGIAWTAGLMPQVLALLP